MAQTPEEKRAYARGYQAGRKRSDAENAKWDKVHAEIHGKDLERKDQFFCAALTGVLSNQTWKPGDRPTNAEQYVDLAKTMANLAVQKLPRFGL